MTIYIHQQCSYKNITIDTKVPAQLGSMTLDDRESVLVVREALRHETMRLDEILHKHGEYQHYI